ncbi:MAG TPA: hypothetical protein VE476_16415 [Propionibacteriaceae bacterium]|nr:hypothetical protein [Propionibacteriaceae bacterium]
MVNAGEEALCLASPQRAWGRGVNVVVDAGLNPPGVALTCPDGTAYAAVRRSAPPKPRSGT